MPLGEGEGGTLVWSIRDNKAIDHVKIESQNAHRNLIHFTFICVFVFLTIVSAIASFRRACTQPKKIVWLCRVCSPIKTRNTPGKLVSFRQT